MDNPIPQTLNIPEGWTQHQRPPGLFRRFAFAGYGETRDFLDRLADLSKDTDCYPDISFGKEYANVTLHARDDTVLTPIDCDFAARINALVTAVAKT